MTVCTTKTIEFSRCQRRKVQVNFEGGEITSDAGAMLLKQADKLINLTGRVASTANDPRNQDRITHSIHDMLRQRVYGIALGYEDLNDHDMLRKDIAIQTSVGKDTNLASSPTLCRFENFAGYQMCVDMSKALVEVFIESFATPPEEIVLDFDATDDLVHGDQLGRHFHGYYDAYCFLPLYVFCGKHILAAPILHPVRWSPKTGQCAKLCVTQN